MKKGIYIIILSLILILSVNFISAAELTNNSLELTSSDNLYSSDEIIAISDSDNINQLSEDNSDASASENLTIYVGQNKTDDGGDGSPENPFSTFNLACDYANTQNKSQVTLNIYNGTYYLDNHLKFNTSNLVINGIGSPIIKNFYKEENTVMAFGLAATSSKYTISNVIYDASDVLKFVTKFSLFYGESTYGEFNNCSFVSYNDIGVPMIVPGGTYNVKFNNCYFYETHVNTIFPDALSQTSVIEFENCSFNLPNCESLFTGRYEAQVTMTNCWLGKNTFPTFINPPSGYMYNKKGKWITTWKISVNGYAQFSISENYLGSNQYEIIGKLTWDDENNTASMENFQPMNVSLSSLTGEIQSYAILTNGTFRAIYTSNSTEHAVSAVLGSEFKEVTFKSINVTVDAPSIYYGEDQNITVILPQAINATANVIINNKTYNLTFNDTDSVTYTIEDRLTEGNYTVDVILSDVENHVWGSNSTVLSVSKVSNYIFDVIPAVEVKVGENATIDITLPEDVEGNVTIKFGNDTKILPANQTMTVGFTNLNATTYDVTVTYSGSDKYIPNKKTDTVTVDKGDSNVIIENIDFTYGEVIAIPFTPINTSGVNVRVLNKSGDEVANTTSEGTQFTLETLPAGEYTLKVTTIANDNYNEFTAEDVTLTINKAESGLTLNDSYEFVYGENAVINVVTENSTGDVIVSLIGEKEFAANVSGNKITLPALNGGKYTLTVTTNVDDNHNNVTKSATVTIIKTTPLMNIVVEPLENITVKDNVTLTINLPSDATGEVTVKINGKKIDTLSANETITVNLNNQAGDYVVDVTYSGDKNYESDMATEEFTISKVETSITAKQIDFEEGNVSKIEVTVPDVESGIVLIDVAGKKFYGDIDNGKATITLEGVSEGNYTANVKFFGDEKYKEATTAVDVKVSEDKIITELKEQLEEAKANVTQLKENLDVANGKVDDLTIQLNETQANATKLAEDLDVANAKVSNLTTQLNETQVNVTKLADELKDANQKAENLTTQLGEAQKQIQTLSTDLISTTVAAKNLSIKALTNGNIQVTLKANGTALANKTVNVIINGVVYNGTTGEEGIAKIAVKFASAGTYYATVTFAGDDTYKSSIGTSKVVVSKKATKITAPKKSFKAKVKTKKVKITLKSGSTVLKSKKITLKVNGKTYTAKTNSKGVATIKVTKLTKKGTFTYTVKFAGDKAYKAITKKGKLTIK